MLFNSSAFLLFFGGVLFGDLCLRRHARPRKVFLLLASAFFYACWDWRFLGLIAVSTLVDWFVGGALPDAATSSRRRALLGLSLAANLGLLGIFKYYDFFVGSADALLRSVGLPELPLLHLILPVGISFYTFQTLSYTLDIYRGRLAPVSSLLDFSLFVAFFPQLVAGPIVRAREFLPQLQANPLPSERDRARGLADILAGLFRKIVVADAIGAAVSGPYYAHPEHYGFWGALVAQSGFAFQVYGDFAGYSQIAIGAARMLGFRLPQNFDSPYTARTFTDLIRRWHMTLMSWMRDYVYFPLGGSRRGNARTVVNVLLTLAVVGLWHGASWKYLIWGLLLGIGILVSQWREQRRRAAGKALSSSFLAQTWQRLSVFSFWILAGVFFGAPTVPVAVEALRAFLRSGGVMPPPQLVVGVAACALWFLGGERWGERVRRIFVAFPPELRGACTALLLALYSALAVGGQPFVYFQF